MAMTDEDWKKIRDLLGEAIHTGFRKAVPDSVAAGEIHRLIRDMDEECEWTPYVDWVHYALYYSIEGRDPPPEARRDDGEEG